MGGRTMGNFMLRLKGSPGDDELEVFPSNFHALISSKSIHPLHPFERHDQETGITKGKQADRECRTYSSSSKGNQR